MGKAELSTRTLEGHTEQEMEKETAVEENRERNQIKCAASVAYCGEGGESWSEMQTELMLPEAAKGMRLLFQGRNEDKEEDITLAQGAPSFFSLEDHQDDPILEGVLPTTSLHFGTFHWPLRHLAHQKHGSLTNACLTHKPYIVSSPLENLLGRKTKSCKKTKSQQCHRALKPTGKAGCMPKADKMQHWRQIIPELLNFSTPPANAHGPWHPHCHPKPTEKPYVK